VKRPQLKTPELKVPAVLSDLYYDLRDRRLLPLIGLLAVAIVATPFLLGQGSEALAPPPTPAAIQALKESEGRPTASLTVVEANPGLRDYRRRLRNRTPLDPFREPPQPNLKGAQLGKGSSGKEGSSSSSASFNSTSTTTEKSTTKEGSKTTTKTTKTTTTTTGKGSGGSGGDKGSNGTKGSNDDGGSTAGGGGGNKATVYTVDVQISTPGQTGATTEPVERRNVEPATPLPGKKIPVVTYLGAGSGAGRALFSVSKQVSAVYGEARCVSGKDTCEVLELEPDFPVTLVYGAEAARYKIKLLRIKPAG
jgi:hypothetical protein